MKASPPLPGGESDGHLDASVAAFFDLDKTIIAKTSMVAFRGPLYERGLLSRRTITMSLFAQLIYLHIGIRERGILCLRNAVLRLIAGWDQAAIDLVIRETLVATIDPLIYAEAINLLEWHRAEGHRVVIVSASPQEIVSPLSEHLGAETCVASTAEIDARGKYTGKISFYAFGRDKADALEQWAMAEGVDLSHSYAYSDSVSDLPMLSLVGFPVVVNGNRELNRYAREHGWASRTFEHPVALRNRIREHAREITPHPSIAFGLTFSACMTVLIGWTWMFRRRWRSSTIAESSP